MVVVIPAFVQHFFVTLPGTAMSVTSFFGVAIAISLLEGWPIMIRPL